jgi:hypothetical protein
MSNRVYSDSRSQRADLRWTGRQRGLLSCRNRPEPDGADSSNSVCRTFRLRAGRPEIDHWLVKPNACFWVRPKVDHGPGVRHRDPHAVVVHELGTRRWGDNRVCRSRGYGIRDAEGLPPRISRSTPGVRHQQPDHGYHTDKTRVSNPPRSDNTVSFLRAHAPPECLRPNQPPRA